MTDGQAGSSWNRRYLPWRATTTAQKYLLAAAGQKVINNGNSLFTFLSILDLILLNCIQKEKHAIVRQGSLTLRLEHKPVCYNARSTLNQGIAIALPTGEGEWVNVPSLNSRHNPEINRLWPWSLFTCHGKNNSKSWLLLLVHFPLRTLPTSKAPFEVFLHLILHKPFLWSE